MIPGEAYGELPIPTLADHSFLGWFTEAEGGEQITADMTVPLADQQTLYALWKPLNPITGPSITVTDIGYDESGAANVSAVVRPTESGTVFFACYAASGRMLSTTVKTLEAEGTYSLLFSAESAEAAYARLILLDGAFRVQGISEEISLH